MSRHICFHLPPKHPWRDLLKWFDSVGSTNTLAKEMAAQGAPHGTILIADHQTEGRGRLGRTFHSPNAAGIYMSVILRPQCPPMQLMHLTCAVAVAVCDAVEKALGFRPSIKWINDLVVDGKKLGGILTELSIDPKTGLTDYAVIGIGINCTQRSEDFSEDIRSMACSAAMFTKKAVDRSRLAAAMITELEEMSRCLLSEKEDIMARYRQDCVTIGSHVQVLRGDEKHEGIALDVDCEGALIVTFTDGHTEAVSCGEVSVRGMYGYT